MRIEIDDPPAFLPAHNLDESAGFARCGRFGGYADDPYSVFMSLQLPAPPSRN